VSIQNGLSYDQALFIKYTIHTSDEKGK